MAARLDPEAVLDGRDRGRSESAVQTATDRNVEALAEIHRIAEQIERRILQSQRMIEQAANTVAATRRRRVLLARMGL